MSVHLNLRNGKIMEKQHYSIAIDGPGGAGNGGTDKRRLRAAGTPEPEKRNRKLRRKKLRPEP